MTSSLVEQPVPGTSARPDSRTPLRMAIIGCGAVAERYHLPALLASTDVTIVACSDPVLARAQAMAATIGTANAVDDHRRLRDGVDAAIVTAGNAAHAPLTIDLLRAGVHVLVEKPMARTVAECTAMCDAARESGAVLAVGHDFRFFPVARAARDLLAAQVLGPVRRVDVRQSAGTRWPCVSPAAVTPESGGGVVMSFGVHTIDLLLWWLGGLTPVWYRDDAMGGVEAECACELRTHDGTPVYMEISRRRGLRDTARFVCDGGTLDVAVFEPAFIRTTLGGGAPMETRVIDPQFDAAPLKTVFGRQLADFVDAIDNRRAPLVDGAAGLAVIELVTRCYAIKQPLRREWDYPEAYDAARSGAQP